MSAKQADLFVNATREMAFEAAAKLIESYEPALAAELRHGCLNLHPGEPFFVVRAQDVTSAGTVDHWINMNRPSLPAPKLRAAEAVSDAMRRWGGPRKSPD